MFRWLNECLDTQMSKLYNLKKQIGYFISTVIRRSKLLAGKRRAGWCEAFPGKVEGRLGVTG